MSRTNYKIILGTFGLGLLAGCASAPPTFQTVSLPDLSDRLQKGSYTQKTRTFHVLMDTSSSVAERYDGTGFQATPPASELDVEKEILRRLNRVLPASMQLTAGLRTFGSLHCNDWQFTRLVLRPAPYDKQRFAQAVDSITCASGVTPLGHAIEAATHDLEGTAKPIALLILTDGEAPLDNPVAAAEALKQKYGDNLCIYTIDTDTSPAGDSLLQQLVEIGRCGKAYHADDLASTDDLIHFVETVFLSQVPDTDGDGVPDTRDRCPGTPAGVEVDESGCPLDTDGDGVPDYKDKCPQTPKGIRVNEIGCWVGGAVLFDFDKTEIRPEAYPFLDEVADILRKNPQIKVEIQGHTDSVGPAEYNLKLSQRRAEAVRRYLIDKGIAPERLIAKGYGESHPIAPNDTAAGRAQNRRVIFVPIK